MEIILISLLLLNIIISIIAIPGILKKNDKQVVTIHKTCPIVGIIDIILMSIACFAILKSRESIGTAFCFYCFTLIGIAMVIAYFNCRITYNNTHFTVKNFFGNKKSYKIDDIIFIKYNSFDVRIHVEGKIIVIDTFSEGNFAFTHFLNIRYKSTHNGKTVPTSPPKGHKSKPDLFNGNVEQPEALIIAYILVGLVSMSFVAGALVNLLQLTEIEFQQQKFDALSILGMSILFLFAWIFYIIMSIRIGRHPENYSDKVIYLFFKNGYVHKSKSK